MLKVNLDAYRYLMFELIDNIYQHSEFKYAYTMAQYYRNQGFVELGFLDDGITIAGSFNKNAKANFTDINNWEAIDQATKGATSKGGEQRGCGLSSSISIAKALGGDVLIVSGYGAIYINPGLRQPYLLHKAHQLRGTLISLRIPLNSPRIDIYMYLQ
ncbi:MAG: hypothetical protein JRN66_05740 [Nitrososphaerota archaeon]|nr:hypothetical protein [Nitrososphaerota archaeon]